MKILLTGATGFVGQYVLRELINSQAQDEVYVLARDNQLVTELGVKNLIADLHNESQVRQVLNESHPDVLLHLAWYTEHGKFWNSPQNLEWSKSTLNLVRHFIAAGGKNVVVAGTCAEYSWEYGYCLEDHTPLAPATIYGKAKNLTHQYLEQLCSERGATLRWGRIFFPYGHGEPLTRLMPSVIISALKDEEIKCSHGQQYRDFLHVRDVAKAFVRLTQPGVPPGNYNVSSGEPIKLAELIIACAEEANRKARVAFGAVQVPATEPMMLVGNNKKLTQLGWRPEIDLRSGIRDYVKQLKRH